MGTVDAFVEHLSGKTIHQLCVQEHWTAGALSDPVTVLFLELAPDDWVRLLLDAGVFSWRPVAAPVVPESVGKYQLALRQTGVSGDVAETKVARFRNAASLDIRFADGQAFHLDVHKK